MIYDVIPVVPSAYSNTSVNATIFTAECGTIPDAVQTDFSRSGDSDNIWTFDIGSGVENVEFYLPNKDSLVISPMSELHGLLQRQLVYWSLATSSTDLGLNKDIIDSTAIVVAATLPIIDASGAVTPPIQIHPVVEAGETCMSHFLCMPAASALTHLLVPPTRISSLQMFACNIISKNTTIQVSSGSRTPIDVPPTTQNTLWRDWTPTGPTSDPILLGVRVTGSFGIIADDLPRFQACLHTLHQIAIG